jgi:hypothetical protein
MPTTVTTDNFVRAETDRYLGDMSGLAGGVGRWWHLREPTAIDAQTVVRMNRDTLYSAAVVDISAGATVTLPDAGERYLSVMVVNQDHYINEVLHAPGPHELTVDRYDTPYVLLAARILVDPTDPADLAEVHGLQDALSIDAAAARPYERSDYDAGSLDAVRAELIERSKSEPGFSGAFGRREDVDPERHLVGTAIGWGGLPDTEAHYLMGPVDLPVGEYRLTARDVPVDAFWSISVYDAKGYFAANDRGVYNINSLTAVKDADGAVTVHFGGCDDGRPNCLPIMEGWNYTVRLYRPRSEILDGTYEFPEPVPVE